jgi:hypothetical protein
MPVRSRQRITPWFLLLHQVQFIWFFLALAGSAEKTLIHGYWISLDFLGFPWILSSESRLINGLHGKNHQTFFLRRLFLDEGQGQAHRRNNADA